MKTTDELVHELADREAIRELGSRYCDYIWRQNLEELVALFVDDGIFLVQGLEREAVARGHAELRNVYQKAFEDLRARLVYHLLNLGHESLCFIAIAVVACGKVLELRYAFDHLSPLRQSLISTLIQPAKDVTRDFMFFDRALSAGPSIATQRRTPPGYPPRERSQLQPAFDLKRHGITSLNISNSSGG